MTQLQHTSILLALLSPSAIHDPIFSSNTFRFLPNTVTNICQSLHYDSEAFVVAHTCTHARSHMHTYDTYTQQHTHTQTSHTCIGEHQLRGRWGSFHTESQQPFVSNNLRMQSTNTQLTQNLATYLFICSLYVYSINICQPVLDYLEIYLA